MPSVFLGQMARMGQWYVEASCGSIPEPKDCLTWSEQPSCGILQHLESLAFVVLILQVKKSLLLLIDSSGHSFTTDGCPTGTFWFALMISGRPASGSAMGRASSPQSNSNFTC